MAKTSEARIRANKKYNLKAYRKYTFRVRKDDTEIIEKLESVSSKNGYITDLIRKDIKK